MLHLEEGRARAGVGKLWCTDLMELLPVFVNTVLLDHSHAIDLHVVQSCFHGIIAELHFARDHNA